ncbi:hypothetical protein ACFE04_010133 [Oxalis oulophora]
MAECLWVPNTSALSTLIRDVDNDYVFRLNHYPPFIKDTSSGTSKIVFGEHTDPQILTILRSNDVAGLQISLRRDVWVPVSPDPTALCVFLGDLLQVCLFFNDTGSIKLNRDILLQIYYKRCVLFNYGNTVSRVNTTNMGRLKMQPGIKAIEEEPEDLDVTCSNKSTLACMINSEIAAVLANLKALRKQIFSWQHQWHNISSVAYLQPFLDVIRSDETGAPITSVALLSVYKILTLDVIVQTTANVEDAMHLVVDVVTNCRFEVTDPASEVVLMKILQVFLACLKSKVSVMLSNQHVCTLMNKK